MVPTRLPLPLVVACLLSGHALASTGVCDSNPPTTTDACINAIQAGGTVVNDVFRDKNGRTGPELPVFGRFFNQWPGCGDATLFAGCSGQSQAPFDCPGEYVCTGETNTFASASTYLNALDRQWWQPCRLGDHTLDSNGCPAFGACIGDGIGGSYFPWEGLVFDLGGQSNQVAIFAENDHGPQPCESTEYTVYLTDDPLSRELVQNPTVDGINPGAWNRAVLSSIYTKGFADVRAPDPAGHAACGDTADYAVEEDSFVTVYALPCGVTFRYAAIVAGNDGLDFAECAFDSNEAELDAVAGLSEDGAAVCPDVDGDLFPDCNCVGAPAVCDCDDQNASIHPGAPEACDSAVDVNCDGAPGSCDAGLTCHDSRCLGTCEVGEVAFCPGGATCESTTDGLLCVPADCTTGGCPDGAVCTLGRCVPDCSGVVCPSGQQCRDGNCVDPCAGVACPAAQVCEAGACHAPCTCLAGDLGCASEPGSVCAVDGSCTAPACVGVTCGTNEHCDDVSGLCVGLCAGVVCPVGETCDDVLGCHSVCDTVTCDVGLVCDPLIGTCVDASCAGIVCTAPLVCEAGVCVDGTAVDAGPAADAGPSNGGADAGPDGGNGAVPGCGCAGDGTDRASVGLLVGVLALLRRRRARRA